jgi:hypothetical protein
MCAVPIKKQMDLTGKHKHMIYLFAEHIQFFHILSTKEYHPAGSLIVDSEVAKNVFRMKSMKTKKN